MPKGIKKCKVCGCNYEYCRTIRSDSDIFRWQDVACCQEHGAIYFARVAASRRNTTREVATNDYLEDEELDALFEEDFNDSDEELEIER